MKAAGTWLAAAGCVLAIRCAPETEQSAKLSIQPPATAATAADTVSAKFSCYFPESCYRLAAPVPAPPTMRHRELAGRVFVDFIVDSLLQKRAFRIACARLSWKKTGRQYAADCQHLTTTQQRALLLLVTPLMQPLRFASYRPDRRGCGQERWTMPVTFR